MRLKWRVQSDDEGGFDEIAVTSKAGCLIHAEMMDERSIFVSIGSHRVWAYVNKQGVVKVTGTEDDE